MSPCGNGASELCLDIKDFGYGKCSTCTPAGSCTCAVSLSNPAAQSVGMWHCMWHSSHLYKCMWNCMWHSSHLYKCMWHYMWHSSHLHKCMWHCMWPSSRLYKCMCACVSVSAPASEAARPYEYSTQLRRCQHLRSMHRAYRGIYNNFTACFMGTHTHTHTCRGTPSAHQLR